MKFPAIRSVQNGIVLYSTQMTVADMAQVAKTDFSNPDSGKDGYQRHPNSKRYFEIANYVMQKRAALPPAIVMSFRGKVKTKEIAENVVEIDIPKGENLWVIDGQHRLGGLKLLAGLLTQEDLGPGDKDFDFNVYNRREYASFQQPVVIMECDDVASEAHFFAIINSKAKKVSKYLANEGILRGDESKGEKSSSWDTRATEITVYLNDTKDSPFFGHLKHPNSPRDGNYFCSRLGVLNSLEDILKDPFYREEWPKNSAKIKRMVLEYWDAWYAVAPFAFTAHRDYAMFKNSGLIALNTCVPYIAQRLKKDYPTKADFVKVIEKLGRFKEANYWDTENKSGMVGRLGKGQIKDEAELIKARITEVTG
jgi:DGQHR domain-containing protein